MPLMLAELISTIMNELSSARQALTVVDICGHVHLLYVLVRQ